MLKNTGIPCCFTCGYPKKNDKEKRLYGYITHIGVVSGLNTDLQINEPVYDIEFELTKKGGTMNKQELQKEINKTKEHLANMEKMLAECESERWKPKYGQEYYYSSTSCQVFPLNWYDTEANEEQYRAYNCFQTREQAEAEAEKILVRRMLEDIARRLNKGEKVGYDHSQKKYYIFWNSELDELRQIDLYWARTQGVVYCLDENFLNVAIQEIGEERLKRYLRGE